MPPHEAQLRELASYVPGGTPVDIAHPVGRPLRGVGSGGRGGPAALYCLARCRATVRWLRAVAEGAFEPEPTAPDSR